ncbi:MAG TPA: GNAT family protein [Pseudonocardiaceae bacterium]|nr:GNAT family protein [Pseudonocardiaceae bacterium]
MTALEGGLVRLRARVAEDIPALDAELHDDVPTHVASDGRPWRPYSPGAAASPYAIAEPSPRVAAFSVVRLADGELAGEASLWAIDSWRRSAHVGLALRAASRGRGLGTDVVRVLCRYGFTVLGLHRLQVETLATNRAMLRVAERVGFRREAVHREVAWVMGEFADEVLLGMLDREWAAERDRDG